ncbi:protein ECT2 isoform X2 [Syngnathoides biaculeatus]|uniref:protein ECT2 isoform X2 n=1 Tax=Syngnathoides biaculeatus TaxID=300417 RepID=UPI002ADD8DE9|nr:protein ECT2 isoform X2 [Syngnathoides biaculeatus]
MGDNSIVTFGTARSLLVDSSVYDSRIEETTNDHVFLGMACDDGEGRPPKVKTRIVLVGEASKDAKLVNSLQAVRVMEVPVVKIGGAQSCPEEKIIIKSIVNMEITLPFTITDNIQEFSEEENTEFETVFVLTDFKSPDYRDLYKRDHRIIGPPVVLRCVLKEEPIPFSCRPLYSTTMMNLSLCFTGFRNKEELKNLVSLVHHMGGIIRKDFSTKVTHLIAHSTHGEKYKLAVCMGTPILTPSWIYKAWERRNDESFHAGEEDFRTEFKVPPFQDCILSFWGFSEEERTNMEERTLKHGGQYLDVGNESCTHLVVDDNSVKELPYCSLNIFVVKQEWFWGSIQMDARAGESMYRYVKNVSPTMKKTGSLLSLSTPNCKRKCRLLSDTLVHLTKEAEISPFPLPPKRPSPELSLTMGSLLDITITPDTSKPFTAYPLPVSSKPSKNAVLPKLSARWQVSKELYQTESNYVDILNTVLQIFKLPLEKEGQVGGPILAPEEIKAIFGSIPDIYEVHTRIKSDLEDLLRAWSEEKSVGDIVLKYSKDLVKAYPPFVNFFEMSKDTIVRCEKQKPRFHAFLKINQAKPECGRQALVELLIRPVQRLPSVALLLNDIKKHTSDENPDKIKLDNAIESLKEVMTHINEDKRKTDGQKQIFDVVYDVDGCPANLLSSHRSLVYKVETIALGDRPCDRGEHVTLFLFSDCLEAELIHCTDPDSLQVSTKDMDSTLSKASRAIKKTSKKVTRAFSFTKTPKRVIQRAFMSSSTPDDKKQRLSSENPSTLTLAFSGHHSPPMAKLASTFESKYHTFSQSTSQLF